MSAPPPGFGDMYPGFISVEAEMKSLGWDDGIAPPRLRDLFEALITLDGWTANRN